MEAFLHPLQGLAEFEEIKKRCGANCGILNVSGCMESQKVHLMYGLSGLFPYHLILADDERNAKEIYEDYRFYDKNVYFYPAKDLLFFQADIHGNLLIRQRMRVIRALLEQEEVTVVTRRRIRPSMRRSCGRCSRMRRSPRSGRTSSST